MRPKLLFRVAGVAAFVGGAARMVASFPVTRDAIALEALYAGVDILLLFGLIGIYLRKAKALGPLGLLCFAAAVAALSFIGGPDADPFGFSTYETGAAALAIAMATLGLIWIFARQRPFLTPFYWVLALAAGAAAPHLAAGGDYAVTAAGLLFGAGFAFAGIELIVRPEGQA
jgi:hypothetical protein